MINNRINLQMFKGKGGSTTTYNYTPSPEERALMAKQLEYQNAFYPNVIKLNDNAGDVLWGSYGTVQADYSGMNNNAQNQVAQAQNNIGQLQQGALPSAYLQNFTDATRSGVQSTVGNAVNTLGARGVLDSSVTNKAINDIEANVANQAAQNFNNNIATQSQLAQQQIENASTPITISAAAQEAAQQPALNLWNASLGLQQSGNSVLGNISGKWGSSVQNTANRGNFGSFLGGAATGLAGNSGFWNYLGGK